MMKTMNSKFSFDTIKLITDSDYFIEAFYQILSSGDMTHKQAYYTLEDIHDDITGNYKYASFESFKTVRNRKISKGNKVD